MIMTEKVKARIQNTVKYKKVDGTLTLTSSKVTWNPVHGEAKKFQCSYSEIKVQRISPETSSKVQLQLVLHTEVSCNFQFANPSGRAAQLKERNVVKDLLAELIPAHREKTNKDLEEKNKLFNENSDLYQLYKDLVVTGIITAEEFWENQKPNSSANDKQDVGIASGLLAELKPDMHGCNELRFNLTADSIGAIFKMYPTVKKKYLATVPDEMTEKEFWTEFFQSQHFHRDRIQKKNSSNKDVFGELAKKDEQEELLKTVSNFIDPLIDFSPSCPFQDEGYGAVGTKRSSNNGPLIQHFNHQSLMVLKNVNERGDTINSDTKRKRIREAVEFDELEKPHEDIVPVLKIVDMDKFSFSTISNGHQNGYEAHLLEFKNRVLSWKLDLPNVLSSDSAKIAISEVVPGGKYAKSSSQLNFTDNIPSHFQQEMRKNYLALSELLKHFWTCFPIKSPQLEEKVRRMATSLEKFKATKLANFSCSLPSHSNQLCDHMNEMVTVALKKFNAWEERRNKSGKT